MATLNRQTIIVPRVDQVWSRISMLQGADMLRGLPSDGQSGVFWDPGKTTRLPPLKMAAVVVQATVHPF